MTPSKLASLQTRVTRYCGEDKRERAVLLWSDYAALIIFATASLPDDSGTCGCKSTTPPTCKETITP